MDELVSIMEEILLELRMMNSKLDDIQGLGLNDSIADVCDKIDELGENLEFLIGMDEP